MVLDLRIGFAVTRMDGRKKVLILIRQLDLGGAEAQTFELSRGLAGTFQVVVCTLRSGGIFYDQLKKEGIPVAVIQKRCRYDLTLIPRLVKLIRMENPDILHCVMWTANIWGGLAWLFSKKPKLILSSRSIGIWKSRAHLLIGTIIFNRADLVLANSLEVRDYMVAYEHVRPDLIRIVHNGVNLERFSGASSGEISEGLRKELGIGSSAFVVGTVANLTPQKDYPTLLAAAQIVAAKKPEVVFLIVGDGILRSEIEREVASRDLASRFRFTGQRRDVERLLACMNVFVLSSKREGFSNALLEAMASGLPTIATRVGGNISATIEGTTGYLFDGGDAAELARLIVHLVDNARISREMGVAAKARVIDGFGMGPFLSNMAEVYMNVLAAGPRSRLI